MTRRLVRNLTFEGAVQTILDDSIALLGAEYGNVQLPIGEEPGNSSSARTFDRVLEGF
jgi:hypothetical protein